MEITPTKSMLRKILVLITANTSSPFEIFTANICVVITTDTTKISIISIEKNPIEDVIIKNQNESPAVTASDLNLDEDDCILYRINECH
jgi:hypothetical protein